mmetsp:Transcript_29039/g.81240  ORF Transcript_29039/g.81240 Transcript_29039/m.81240 type:complete len:212 (-) Transcript_29039:1609-2244(-)
MRIPCICTACASRSRTTICGRWAWRSSRRRRRRSLSTICATPAWRRLGTGGSSSSCTLRSWTAWNSFGPFTWCSTRPHPWRAWSRTSRRAPCRPWRTGCAFSSRRTGRGTRSLRPPCKTLPTSSKRIRTTCSCTAGSWTSTIRPACRSKPPSRSCSARRQASWRNRRRWSPSRTGTLRIRSLCAATSYLVECGSVISSSGLRPRRRTALSP